MRYAQILLICIAFSARAEAQPLGFADLLTKARERSEALGLARASLQQVKAQHRINFGEWLPQVTLKASENFAEQGNTALQSPALRINAREDFLKGLDQPAALKASKAALAQAEAEIASADLALVDEVGTAYFDVLSLEEEIVAEAGVLEAAEGSAKELKSRVGLGRNRQAELSSAQAQVARIQAIQADLQGQLAEAREALASLCGIEVTQALAPVNELATAPEALGDVNAAIEKLPAVEAARQALELAKAQKLAAKGGFFPNLFAEGNYHVARQNGVSGPAWDAQVGIDLPLFQGGAQVARVNGAEAQLQSAQLRLERARREAARELRQSWQGLKQSLLRAEASRLALVAAEKSYADQQKDFRNSLVTSLDLFNAFQAVENARLEQLRIRYATHRAQLRYGLATGQPLHK